ncbi:hypothetical protein CISIN_1g037904mg [Citrus sinensis]|uniref:NB-ARC domain-containing protein n=1 Tax=Citrus sinensis TaxID=2711 RepID=A0A067DU30_CITSI|nr:hypothetical protein CISIN_1g037904mg [Citrus sinensis]
MSSYEKWGRQIVRRQFPQEPGNCSRLWEEADTLWEVLSDGTDIKEPLSIELLFGLVQLTLNGCKNLEHLPRTISALKYLSTLNLSGLLKFREFPEKTSSRDELLEIHLEGTAIRGLPASIELLFGNAAPNLKNVPETLGNVESLEVRLSCHKRAKMQNDFDCVEQIAKKDSDSWKKNVDEGIKLSATAI